MTSIAEALVFATAYINSKPLGEDAGDDLRADMKALEFNTRMNNLAEALVFATAYIAAKPVGEGEDDDLDADVQALESIAWTLRNATDAEQESLATAADRALREELARPRPRQKLVDAYEVWMEALFGDELWTGNARSSR